MFCSSCPESYPELSSHAARNTTPAGTSPMVTRRHRAMSNLRASATIIVLRSLPALSVLVQIPPGQCTVFLEDQETPSQLDHPAAYSCIARLSEPFLSPFVAALIWRAGKTSIARYSSSIPQLSRSGSHAPACPQFRYQRQSRGRSAGHRMRSFLGSLFQPLCTRLFNLLDLVYDKAQSRYVSTKLRASWRRGTPSGVASVARRSGALRNVGLKFRIPKRARQLFIRFTMRVRSRTRPSRSRFGRFASSSASVEIAAM